MNIEIVHNPVNLTSRRYYKVKSKRTVENLLDQFVESKLSKGYRLRYVVDNDGFCELSARISLCVDMAERILMDSKLITARLKNSDRNLKNLYRLKWR